MKPNRLYTFKLHIVRLAMTCYALGGSNLAKSLKMMNGDPEQEQQVHITLRRKGRKWRAQCNYLLNGPLPPCIWTPPTLHMPDKVKCFACLYKSQRQQIY